MRLLKRVAVLVALAAFVRSASADDAYEKLLSEFQQANQKWYESLPKSEDGTVQLTEEQMKANPTPKFTPRFKALAEQNAGAPIGLKALGWLVSSSQDAETAKWAVSQLAEKYAESDAIGDVLPQLRWAEWMVGREPLVELYERVIKANKSDDTQAAAMFNLAALLASDDPSTDADTSSDKQRAVELFRKIIKEYSDTDSAKQAAAYVYELEHLQIGMTAPEIVGRDADDKEIKLSQYRGQVVVLDFWGFW